MHHKAMVDQLVVIRGEKQPSYTLELEREDQHYIQHELEKCSGLYILGARPARSRKPMT
jgi:hypothetical protein